MKKTWMHCTSRLTLYSSLFISMIWEIEDPLLVQK